MKRSVLFLISTIVFALSSNGSAQIAPGLPSFSNFDQHEVDTVDLLNNNVILHVPIMSKPGTIALRFSMDGNSQVWSTNGIWNSSLAESPLIGSANSFLAPNGVTSNVPVTAQCPSGGSTTKYTHWSIIEANGTTHVLPPGLYSDRTSSGTSCLSGSGFTAQTIDGSGITVTVASNSSSAGSVFLRNGTNIAENQIVDANGNLITLASGVYTDSMGLSALTATNSNFGPFSWTDANGNSPEVSVTTTNQTLQTNFGCSGIGEMHGLVVPLANKASFPDGTSLGISYETTPGFSPDTTGRIGSLTLRGGGSITYSYLGANNGINCTYQSVPELKRVDNDGTTTYTLAYALISGSNYKATNSVVDNGGNKTVYTFTGFTANGISPTYGQVLTEIQHYQGSSTLLSTDVYCYNTTFSSCSFATAPTVQSTLPITRVVAMHQPAGMSTTSAIEVHYDSYGNTTFRAQYEFGATNSTLATTITYGTWNGTQCVALGNTNVNDKQCDVLTQAGTTSVQESRYSYDPNGLLLTTNVWAGSMWLSNNTPNTYNNNGTPSTLYDLGNFPTTYSYSPSGYVSCSKCTQFPFSTSVTKDGFTASTTYNGMGGVKLTDTDANGNVTVYCYQAGSACNGSADPFWRALSITDPLGNIVYNTYPSGSAPTTVNSSFTFNSGNSIASMTTIADGLDRLSNVQNAQSPSGSSYDTDSAKYLWSGNYREIQNTVPCSTTSGAQCSFSSATTTTLLDPLGRPHTVTDGGGGVVTTTYSQNDVLTAASSHPSGENNKQVQNEYDGLGRLTKSCAVGNGSSTACGQNTGSQNGVTTSYSYTYGTGSTTVTATRGVQSRSSTYDALGRLISTTTPEAGTSSYIYDVASNTCGSTTSWGDLLEKVDNSGMHTCFKAGGPFHRLGMVFAWTGTGSFINCLWYLYDYVNNPPSGITELNGFGRIVEAAVNFNCDGRTFDVDEWFSYDKDGQMTDMWEKTPHSGQYYHSVATYFENGKVKTLQLASPSLYTMTYSLDGEGRWNSLADATNTLVSSATFPPASTCSGRPCTAISLKGTDKDTYTFDPNTARMTQYVFTVGSNSMTGGLVWNQNGTLQQLAIADGFNAGGTQTCNFNPTAAAGTGYDDWGRLVGVDCGSSQWGQTFGYDIYDNLTKTPISGRQGTTWNPGYNASNNQCDGCTYDANGNVTGDGISVYGWDRYSKLAWTASSGTPNCGASGRCITYDAFGRIVEQSNGSTWTERWITPLGETAYMNGATILYAYWPAPGGGTVLVSGNGATFNYQHPDWLGNARVTSTLGNHTITADRAYSPFGEQYDTFGSSGSQYRTFASINGNFDPGVMWDTPNRELSIVGRWLSPDPAGAGWNQYAYSTNPNSNIDSLGLEDLPICPFDFCIGPGPGCDPEFGCDPGCDPDFGCGGPIPPPPAGPPPIIPPSNPPGATPPSERTPGVNYSAPWWREWGSVPPWLAGSWAGKVGFPPQCPTDFGAPCGTIGPLDWHTNDQGYIVGDFPGEITCPTGMSYCTIWNSLTNIWDQYQGGNPTQDNRANALGQAINNTGVQTLQNPCTIGGFYAASAAVGAAGVFGPPAVMTAAENPLITLHSFLTNLMRRVAIAAPMGVLKQGVTATSEYIYSECYQ